jgi:trypsin-like peptidase
MRKSLLVGVAVALVFVAIGAGVLAARGDDADGVAAASAAGPGVSPETFARVATGVALIGLHDCTGKPLLGTFGNDGSGTGFLIGSRLLMTAEHVVQAVMGHPRACGLRARIGSRWYEVEEARAWRDPGQKDLRGVDLATLQLAAEAQGHLFELNRVEAPVGSAVAALGYPRGLPLSFTQGFVTKKLTDYGKPTLAANMVIADGNSGGPIIDRGGRVVTVVTRIVVWANQTDGGHYYGGPDFARWWGDSALNDLCRAHPHGGIPGCPSSFVAAVKDSISLPLPG